MDGAVFMAGLPFVERGFEDGGVDEVDCLVERAGEPFEEGGGLHFAACVFVHEGEDERGVGEPAVFEPGVFVEVPGIEIDDEVFWDIAVLFEFFPEGDVIPYGRAGDGGIIEARAGREHGGVHVPEARGA